MSRPIHLDRNFPAQFPLSGFFRNNPSRFSAVLSAQSTTQTIQELVTDPTGAVIPGATVTMNNLATGIVHASRFRMTELAAEDPS
jgi:hypothetical protein